MLKKNSYGNGISGKTLTEDGVTYLREFLHLPEDVIPESYKPKLKTQQDALRRYQDGRKRFSRDGRTDTRRTFGNRRPRDGAQGNEYRPRGFFNRNQTGEKRTFGDRPRFSRTGGFGGDRNFQRRQDGDTQNRKHVWNIRKTDENQANQAPTESNNN
ncbi:ribosomal protein S10 [Anaeramoeba ignava]|uniref:Ribosomal protein S10 n=1 Tax=Anaeramoeba ignava TaxID=1746090 RepID=A0A9Q0RI30_ANAIG|nr:ribosomal protein S10 [Anaeramoeba ignava]